MGRTPKPESKNALFRSVQRNEPFGALSPKARLLIEPVDVHPVIRVAHRLVGGLRTPYRITLDHEFVLIVRGRGVLKYRRKVVPLRGGDLFLIRPFEPHEFIGEGECEHIAVHFDFSPSVPSRGRVDRRKPYEVVFPRGAGIATQTPLPLRGPVASALSELVRVREDGDAAGLLHASALLATVIARLIQTRPTSGEARNRAKLERAIAMIERDPTRVMKVADLAREADLSVPHFNRLFRDWTGRTPMDYLRRHRVEVARQLLSDVDLSIKQVAKRVGFDDPYHFSRVFRQVDGLSPSDYREDVLAGREKKGD